MSIYSSNPPQVIAAIVTPLREDETIDVESLERLIEWDLQGGVDGFFVSGTMGEGFALMDHERDRLIRETVRLVRRRAMVLAGVADAGTVRIKAGIGRIADAGVDAIVTSARAFFPARDRDDTLRLLTSVGECSPVPVWFYENPGMIPVRSTFDEIKRYMEVPNIRGLKFTSPDRHLFMQCVNEFSSRVPVYNGNASDIAFAGRNHVGALVGIAGLLPGLCVRIWRSANRGEITLAEKLQQQVSEVYDIYLGEQWPLWPSAQKYALKRLGVFSSSKATAPFVELNPEQERRIDAVLDRMGASIYAPSSVA